MIVHIRTEGFKGFDINEPVPQKVIYTGKNKSGKSTRSGAIAIALYGYIPFSTAGKRPGDILESFGGESLICAVKIGSTEFARKFSRNLKGVVSQHLQVNGKRAAAHEFAIALGKAGEPKIADVAEFMKQSEAKKIDTLFDLFPNPELATIDTEIEKSKEDVSRLEKKKTGAESTVVRLTNSKQSIEVPAGSVAETQAEIKGIEDQISDLEEQIKQAEIEETKEKAKVSAKKEIAEKGGMSKEEASSLIRNLSPGEGHEQGYGEDFGDDDGFLPSWNSRPGGLISPNSSTPEPFHPDSDSKDDGNFVSDMANQIVGGSPSDSIQRIINALTGAGCGTCAALIIAKRELKKYV